MHAYFTYFDLMENCENVNPQFSVLMLTRIDRYITYTVYVFHDSRRSNRKVVKKVAKIHTDCD